MDFKHIDDIVDWLEPMDYETFWKEIKPFCLVLIPREKCDADIASGGTDEETVLYVMKNWVLVEPVRPLLPMPTTPRRKGASLNSSWSGRPGRPVPSLVGSSVPGSVQRWSACDRSSRS